MGIKVGGQLQISVFTLWIFLFNLTIRETSSSTLNKTLSGITQVMVEAGRPPIATQVRTISSALIPDSSSIITDSTTAEN